MGAKFLGKKLRRGSMVWVRRAEKERVKGSRQSEKKEGKRKQKEKKGGKGDIEH